MNKQDLLRQIIDLSRPLHQQVDAAVATILSETPVTVRMRTVMEAIDTLGPSTVPAIARHMGIQRQYVQVMINEVEKANLAERLVNPDHKRSYLYELTPGGVEVISGIRNAEQRVIQSLARSITLEEAEKAHHVIEHVLKGFRKLNESLAD